MRFLAVDPGEKRLGLAISDPTGTLAKPLTILKHQSRASDAVAILQIAQDERVGAIIIGQALDEEGKPSFEGRRAARLAGALRAITDLPVELWDESGSSQAARETLIALGVPSRKRRGPIDDLAATLILQSYLDAQARMDVGDPK